MSDKRISMVLACAVTVLSCGDTPTPFDGMVRIPRGKFWMGSEAADAGNDEQPVHTVHVDAFYMDTHEVTNLEYKRFVLANPQWQKTRIPRALHDGDYLKYWNGNNYPLVKKTSYK